jgi:hypothetical protein
VVKEVYEADIDDLSSFRLVLEDKPEENLMEEVCSAISDAIIDTANAASNGEEIWKKLAIAILLQNIQGIFILDMQECLLKTIILLQKITK